MPGTKTSALAALTTVADGDLIPVVDVSDTTMASTGTNKRATADVVGRYLHSLEHVRADTSGATDAAAAARGTYANAVAAGKGLFFPPGLYKFTTKDLVNLSFCPMTVGMPIVGVPGKTIIQIDPTVTGWRTVFGSIPWETHDMSGLHVEGITFIGPNETDSVSSASQRYAISAFFGSNISVEGCEFIDWDGRNIILIASNVVDTTKAVVDVRVNDCVLDNIGGSYWHDHSGIYLSGRNVRSENNRISGVAASSSSAWTAMELHGSRVVAKGNIIERYASPGMLVSRAIAADGPSSQYEYAGNKAYDCGSGVTLRPETDMDSIDIHDNDWKIDIDRWPAAASAPYPGFDVHAGVVMYGQNSRIQRVKVHHNHCEYLSYTAGTASERDSFVAWQRELRIASAADDDVHITDNTITNCPSVGVHVENYWSLHGWKIAGNTWRNCGHDTLGTSLQAGIMLGYQAWTDVTRPVGVQDLTVEGEKFIDTQGTHTLSAAIISPAGAVRVDTAAGSTTNASTTVVDANALVTDIGSLITGTNIPAGTIIKQITGSVDGYTGTGYTLSAAATGTGSGITFTITKQHPTFENVIVDVDISKRMRMADGAAVPLITKQSDQDVEFIGAPATVYKTADQSTSDGVNLSDVTGMSFPVDANAIYEIEFDLVVLTAATTTGIAVAFSGPASPTYVRYGILGAITGSAINAGYATAFGTVLVMTGGAITNPLPNRVLLHLENGATAGTVQLRFRSEVDTSAVTIQRGSWGRLTRVA